MINDECDVINCKQKAIYEMEEKNGEIVFVCEEHTIKGYNKRLGGFN